MTALVGGVGELYQGDLDLGRRAAARLADLPLADTVVEDLSYGAIAVAQRLAELRPSALVLVGAERRGRPAGMVQRRRVRPHPDAAAVQRAIAGAGTGYIGIDLLLDVAAGLGVLPARTVVIEAEPASVAPATELTPTGAAALEEALALVVAEARRLPVLRLADDLRVRLAEERLAECPALTQLRAVLDALASVEETGRWAGAFAAAERLRAAIAAGAVPEGMDHLDWGLWWALVEALPALEAAEALGAPPLS